MDFRSWCLHYFPGGKFSTSKDGENYGPVKNPYRDDSKPSLSFGTKGRGVYNDFGGRGGDIKFFVHEHGIPEVWDGAEPWVEHREGGKILPSRGEDHPNARQAWQMWDEGKPAGDHPYLREKGYPGEGLRVTSREYRFDRDSVTPAGTLLIPATDLYGAFQGVERIFPDLSRDKAHRGGKSRCYYGDKPEDGKPLYLVEGWATREALKCITGGKTAVSEVFGLSCMTGFAKAVKELHPNIELVFCPDKPGSGEQRKIIESLKQYGAVVELPEDREKNTDWDDELRRQGIEPARALFCDRWSVAQAEKVEAGRKERPKIRLKKFNAVDLYRANLRSPSWAIDQLIPEGLSVVASPPKVGKSYFVLQAAIAVARGVPFLGQRTTKGPVLLLSLEDTEIRLRKRLVQVIPDLRDIPENLDMMTEFPRLDQEGLATLDDEIKRNGYRLVIIDTWGKTKPVGQVKRGENVYEADVRLVSEVKKIADRYETSIILVHHLKKGGSREPDWLESLSGSMGLSATVDGLLAIERDRKAVLGILKRTGRDLEDDEDIGLKWLQPGWEFNGDAREMMQSAARKEILSSIARAKEPVTPKYIVLDTGGKDSTIRVHLMNMKNAGLVAVTSDGKYYIPQKEEPSDDNVYPVNSLNALNGLNAVNGLNGVNVYGAEDTLNAPVNAINPSDTNDSDGSVYGVYGVYDKRTTGNLEPFFPGGLKTGISSPRGYSVSELAARAGVSEEAIRESLPEWETCGRLKEEGGRIIPLEGSRYPGDDQEPPEDDDIPPEEEGPFTGPKEQPFSSPDQARLFTDHLPDAGKMLPSRPGQGSLSFLPEEPKRDEDSSSRGKDEPPKGLPSAVPSGKRYNQEKDKPSSEALDCVGAIPGLAAQLKARAVKEHDPMMYPSPRALYESLVQIEYAGHLQKELDGEAPGQEGDVPSKGSAFPGEEGGQGNFLFLPEKPKAPAPPPGRNPFLELLEDDDDEG